MKINKFNRKFTYWISKTRKEKARSYIKLKNLVSKEEKTKGRNFFTDHILNAKDSTDEEYTKEHRTWWIDLFFMSKKYKHYYNVTLITKNMAAMDAINELCDSFDTPNRPKELFTTTKIPNSNYLQWNSTPEADIWWLEVAKNKKERLLALIKSGTVIVKNDTVMDFKYSSGIGLHATLDVDDLTEENINAWIEDFWDKGETISPGYDILIPSSEIESMFKRELS